MLQKDFDGVIRFLVQDPSEKTREIAADPNVNVSFASRHGYLSVAGTARLSRDPATIDGLWGPAAQAWFADGREDPSIAVLEDYLHKSLAEPSEGRANVQSAKPRAGRNGQGNGKSKDSGSMSEEEALEILGLRQGAEVWEIEEAHRRMVRKVHPDQGGSNYLTIKVNEAHDLLLGGAKGPARPRPTGSAQKPRPSQRSN